MGFISSLFKLIVVGAVVVPLLMMCSISNKAKREEIDSVALIERAKKDKSQYKIIKPSQFTEMYSQNKFAVDEKFKGKLVSVTGTVSELDKVLSTNVIVLDGEGETLTTVFSKLYMDFVGDENTVRTLFAKIKKGQQIRLLCVGDGGTHFRCYPNSVY